MMFIVMTVKFIIGSLIYVFCLFETLHINSEICLYLEDQCEEIRIWQDKIERLKALETNIGMEE